jgi:hypothetical protein
MSVALDPDWDNTAVLIDCSASKKSKQEELENYAAYAVARKEKEENYGEQLQTPPPGTVELNTTTSDHVVSIVPCIEMNMNQSMVSKS